MRLPSWIFAALPTVTYAPDKGPEGRPSSKRIINVVDR